MATEEERGSVSAAEETPFATIEQALEEIRAGRMIIVTDD